MAPRRRPDTSHTTTERTHDAGVSGLLDGEGGLSRHALVIAALVGVVLVVGGAVATGGLGLGPVSENGGDGAGTGGSDGGLDGGGQAEVDGGSDPVDTGTPSRERESTPEASSFEPPVDTAALQRGHRASLEGAGSFTYRQSYRTRSETMDLGPNRSVTARFDLRTGTSNVTTVLEDGLVATTYGEGEETYERTVYPSGRVEYGSPTDPSGADAYLDSSLLGDLRNFDLLVHRTNASGHVYTVNGADNVSDAAFGGSGEDIVGFDFVAVVGSDGVLRSYDYRATVETDGGETYTLRASGRLVDRGTTTVGEPSWLETARERA